MIIDEDEAFGISISSLQISNCDVARLVLSDPFDLAILTGYTAIVEQLLLCVNLACSAPFLSFCCLPIVLFLDADVDVDVGGQG